MGRFLYLLFVPLAIIILYHCTQNLIAGQIQFTYAIVPEFSFGAVGDWGCTPNTNGTVNNMINHEIKLNLGLGDYSYDSTPDCWFNLISPIKNKTAINIGNHDDLTSSMLTDYLQHFDLQNQFYSFDRENVHFLVMSTEYPSKRNSIQYFFVKNDLSRAAANSNIDWIIVTFHAPIYFSPCPSCVDPNTPNVVRDVYHPLFDEYGVDLVLHGDIHNYQRSYPLKYNPLNSSNPIVTDTNRHEYDDPQGPVFAIIGTGGQGFYGMIGQAPYIVYQQNKYYGYLHVDVNNNGKTLNAKFYTNDGSTLDYFTISKSNASDSAITSTVYQFGPYLALLGSNYEDIMSRPLLQLSKFSVGAWFNTNTTLTSNTFIINKGGFGVDNPGANMNYGIWMTDLGKISAGFESLNGTDYFITSPDSHADGRWHYAVVTYDGLTLRLFIDGVQESSISTFGASPDRTGTQPVRIGANSLFLKGYFNGSIDEVRIWNRSLEKQEVVNLYENGKLDTNEEVIYAPFSHKTRLR